VKESSAVSTQKTGPEGGEVCPAAARGRQQTATVLLNAGEFRVLARAASRPEEPLERWLRGKLRAVAKARPPSQSTARQAVGRNQVAATVERATLLTICSNSPERAEATLALARRAAEELARTERRERSKFGPSGISQHHFGPFGVKSVVLGGLPERSSRRH